MKKIFILFVYLFLTSCSFAPEYQRPDLPVDSQFSGMDAGKSNRERISWDNYFNDPDLKSLIELSLKNNRNLKLASERVQSARAIFGIQKAEQLPGLGAGASVIRAKLPAIGPLATVSDLSAYSVSLGISSWELDFWGRIGSLKEAALEKYLAGVEAQRAAKLILITQVSQSYLYHRELEERLELSLKTLKLRRKSVEMARKRFEVGTGSKLQLNQARILFNQADAQRAVIELLKAKNRNALNLLVGATFLPLSEGSISRVAKYFLGELPVGVPSDLLFNRPDILAAEHELKSANANIGAARAAYFPSITLTGNLGQISTDLNELFDNSSQTWLFMPSVNVPIFTGGKMKSNVELSESKKRAAVSQYELVIQKAFREVSDVLEERRWIKEQIKIQEDTFIAQAERVVISQKRFDRGAGAYLEVLDAERETFEVKQELVQLRRTYLATNISLFSALGGSYLENNE